MNNGGFVKPEIGFIYTENWFEEKQVQSYLVPLDAEGLKLTHEEVSAEPFAGMEWMIPTAVFVFITRSYFSSFLSEMGKDHYHLLKGMISRSWKKIKAGKEYTIVSLGSPNKLMKDNPYSSAFSVLIPLEDKRVIKFLVQKNLSEADLGDGLEAISDMLVSSEIVEKDYWKYILVAYDPDQKKLLFLDPTQP